MTEVDVVIVVEGSLRVGRDDKEWDRDDEGYSIIFEYCLVVYEIIAIFAAE